MNVFVDFFFLSAFSLLIFIKNASGGSCGTFNEKVSNRIVNGSSVGYYKYPWFAVIKYKGEHNCGGVLIANGVILTAAHCIIGFDDDVSTLDVYLGVNDICATTEPNRRSYKIRETKVHKQFQFDTSFYDIAQVFLDGDTSEYEPVCLPTEPQNDNIRPTVGWVQGFGMLYPNDLDNMPCLLQEAELNVYNDKMCRAVLKQKQDEQFAERLEHAFCAGHLEGGMDACQGDSGGPLVALKHDSQRDYYELLGLVSFGFGCAEPGTLVVYTDPSHFYDWLGL